MSYGLLQRWRPSTRSSKVEGRSRPSRRTFRLIDVERGWRVEDSQAVPIGRVADLDATHLMVARGLLVRRLYVPLRAIAVVREGVVVLNVTRAWAEAQDEGRQ